MPIRPILRLGHPTLRGVAQAVPPARIGEPAIQELIDDMIATMRAARGVGLAAPQIGASLQIFVYELAPHLDTAAGPDAVAADSRTTVPESGDGAGVPGGPATLADAEPGAAAALPEGPREAAGPIPLRVVVDPMLTPQAGELVYDWEGCLSIPDLRGLVPRHPAVRVRGLDRDGEPLDYVAQGFEARIIQHEHDHLNGVVFLDRMRDLRALAFREEWERYMAAGASEPSDPADPLARAPQAPHVPAVLGVDAAPPENAAPAPAHPDDPAVI